MDKNLKKAFTLIELLVVVAIIGILAAVGVVAYNGYTASAKRNAALQQHSQIVKFINNTLKLCDVQGAASIDISSTRTINCNVTNNAAGINSLNSVFIGYLLDQGYKNPYGGTDPVVYIGRNSSQDFDGRMRFDETECSSGSSKKQISLWVKTHKDYINKTIAKDGWCN